MRGIFISKICMPIDRIQFKHHKRKANIRGTDWVPRPYLDLQVIHDTLPLKFCETIYRIFEVI